MVTEQELNKKLAKWRFPRDKRYVNDTIVVYKGDYDEIGDFLCGRHHPIVMGLFTESLDACIEWLIYPNQGGLNEPPSNKIINWTFSNRKPFVGTYLKPRAWLGYCRLLNKDENIWSDWQHSYAEAETLALALCLAIEKLIDSKVMPI